MGVQTVFFKFCYLIGLENLNFRAYYSINVNVVTLYLC